MRLFPHGLSRPFDRNRRGTARTPWLLLVVLLLGGLVSGCGPSTHVLKLPAWSQDHSAVPPGRVDVYTHQSGPPCEYERLAIIEVSHTRSIGLFGGVSQVELIRLARKEAATLGADAIIVDAMATDWFTETEIEADSTGYHRTDHQKERGRGRFLAVRTNRSCTADPPR